MTIIQSGASAGVLFIIGGLVALMLGLDTIGMKLAAFGALISLLVVGIDGLVRRKWSEQE